ncbi:TylF/MycF/NovP-related O-methyltransferase [Stieleria varia]|uniref:Demethyldecarbamoylnovobiocin O-methyltransferase n=1 Tax=Stieleria varia TaxID=2528005 RepID=A0A5C6B927_9BACT|nr:TylF/MycF/NovP-related O-methyltransferase [Stieleria varia]TWU08227.1 Demethyldecarbamoylnovobiocin O-methyltransferase [Stieleria varia]
MFKKLKQIRRQRREQRRYQKMGQPSGYPADMQRDVVDTIIGVRDFTMTSPERLHGLCEAVRYIHDVGIQGDIVECGVWRGGSMMAVAKMLSQFGDTDRELHLYDTFSGMSEPTEMDVAITGEQAEHLLAIESREDAKSVWCVSGLDEVRSHMQTTTYPQHRIHYHVGKVEETIPEGAPEKIALLRLDTDWYESTRHEMEHLFPRLADGGVLIVDDYGHWEGARRAVDEYFAEHGIGMMLHRLDYTGRIGIHHASVQRRARNSARDAA